MSTCRVVRLILFCSERDKTRIQLLFSTMADVVKSSSGCKRTSRSVRADVTFPVGRLHRYLRKRRHGKPVSSDASIYLAAVLEYLVHEVLELAATAAHFHKRKYINPRHVLFAVRGDAELDKLLRDVTVAHGGVLPHIALLRKRNNRSTTKKHKQQSQVTSVAADQPTLDQKPQTSNADELEAA